MKQAISCYEQALDIARKTRYCLLEACSLSGLGKVYRDLGNIPKAK